MKNIIPKPCLQNWSEMEQTSDVLIRKCDLCNKNVHDIRSFDKTQINKLFIENNKNLCVFTTTDKIEKRKSFWQYFNNATYYGLIFCSSFFIPNLQAQNKKKLNTYIIEQNDKLSDSIQIEGVIKGEYHKNIRRLKNVFINIYSGDKLVKDFIIDKKGRFKISINKSEIDKEFNISIESFGYQSIKIEDLKKKNTFIEVFMEKEKFSYLAGRFF